MKRRHFLFSCLASALVAAGCAAPAPRDDIHEPIIFIHGHGNTAALWTTTVWRFESNGWPRDRVFALDTTFPFARNEDSKPQPDRTSTADHRAQIAAEVERVRKLTGAEKVVLVANSRGGLGVRDYVRNGGGARTVSHVVLGGTPNHGVWTGEFLPDSEFNGASPYLIALNEAQGPQRLEVTPGVAFMTLRSDALDKYAQPDGRWIDRPQMQTHTLADAPALRGAENVVLPGADHLEVSCGPEAFTQTYRFITGHPPARVGIVPEAAVVLNGKINGFHDGTPTNLPIAGAAMEVYEVSPETGERLGAPAHAKVVGADGLWGPLTAKPGAYYEFMIRADGYAITHIYRSPFPRSSQLVHMRPTRLAEIDKRSPFAVTMVRPRGYFGVGRDRMSLDGVSPPPGLSPGVPGLGAATIKLDERSVRSVVAEFNGERIAVRTWPASEDHAVRAEFHY